MSAVEISHLPKPHPELLAHSQTVTHYIAEKIARQGPITFAEYMADALYAPNLGYYDIDKLKFGPGGDFVTSPEISPLYGACLAKQIAQVLQQLGGGDVLELGAGSGVMALSLLQTLASLEQLPQRYYILELSSALKARQQQLLREHYPEYYANIVWLERWPETPINGVIVANEVLDAMPVSQFQIDHGELKEVGVDYQSEQFVPCLLVPSNDLVKQVTKLGIDFTEGYQSEINLALPAWISEAAASLQAGVMLLVDYGYPRDEFYLPERSEGTVMCHIGHYAHPYPLVYPGIQDITAHVDFSAVAEAAVQAGLTVAGFTTQAHFLLNLGLVEWLEKLEDPTEKMAVAQQIKILTMPHEMGEIFKAIALAKGCAVELSGFSHGDQRHRL